jgi:hypothetical protein
VLETIEVRSTERVGDRPYEWVLADARYAVDPDNPGTARIADLQLVPRDADGKVRFSGILALLRPTEGGNRRAILSVPNRGSASLPFSGTRPNAPTAIPDPADAYLMDEGWTVAFPGWQWDVPDGFLGLIPPVVDVEPGWLRSDLRIDAPIQERSLGDVGQVAGIVFAAYPTIDLGDPDAVLRVRVAQMGPSEVVPRSEWWFTSPTTIAVQGGFRPQRWYELIYRSAYAPVVGAGLLAVRDMGMHLRAEHDAVFAHGVSQSGRFLRELLFEGLNLSEDGRQVFDGVMPVIASARRGEFNRRFAQPSLLAPMMPEYGPPYDSTSLLARQRERGGTPKVMLVNSAAEYWRGDGALVHQDAETGADLPEDPDVRAHLISGTDHLGNLQAMKDLLPVGNPPHYLDPGAVNKALFVQLVKWALEGAEPTPSMVPRLANGTAVPRETVLEAFPKATRPDSSLLPYTPAIDPDRVEWPLPLGAPRAALVSALDGNGNEVAGIRLPQVQTGVAAYTGWNARRQNDGIPDVLYDLVGSRLPSLSGSSPSEDDLRDAAEFLAARRLILPTDVDRVVTAAVDELSSRAGRSVGGATVSQPGPARQVLHDRADPPVALPAASDAGGDMHEHA